MMPYIVSGSEFDIIARQSPLNIDRFPGCEITEVTPDMVTMAYDGKSYSLRPGSEVWIQNRETDEDGRSHVIDCIGVAWPFVKSDRQELYISVDVRADRSESGFAIRIPILDFPDGVPVRINEYFNSLYRQYLKPIDITVNQNDMSIDSAYLKGTVRFDRPLRKFTILRIGLSYASCNLSIELA